jgi:hypothetical protein
LKGSIAEPASALLPDSARPSLSILILSSDADFDYSLVVGPNGQSRTFTLRGRISAPSHPIDGKPGTLVICEDDKRAETLRTERNACGSLILFRDGELKFGDTFRALLHVKRDIADTIDRAITSVQIGRRMLSVELDVALQGLPNDRKHYLSAGDLDIRDERVGDILGLKLWPWSWKPGQTPALCLQEQAIDLHLSVTEGRWWGMLPLGADMLSFRGVIESSQLPQLVGLLCNIELREHQISLGGRYPLAGEFSLQYSPEITLFYRASELSTRLQSLMKCQRAWLSVKLVIDKPKLLAKLSSIQSEDVTGRITSCTIGAEVRIDSNTRATSWNIGKPQPARD